MTVPGVEEIGRHIEPTGPTVGDPGLVLPGYLRHMVVLDSGQVPDEPTNRISGGFRSIHKGIDVESGHRPLYKLSNPTEGINEDVACFHLLYLMGVGRFCPVQPIAVSSGRKVHVAAGPLRRNDECAGGADDAPEPNGRWSLMLMAIAGLYGVVRERERSLAVFITTTLGLLVLAYAIAEVASPLEWERRVGASHRWIAEPSDQPADESDPCGEPGAMFSCQPR
jgi:hypothetical protein